MAPAHEETGAQRNTNADPAIPQQHPARTLMNWFVHSRPNKWYTRAKRFALLGLNLLASSSESQRDVLVVGSPVVEFMAHSKLDDCT